MKDRAIRTADGKPVTMQRMLFVETSSNFGRSTRFAVNYARHQYGPRTGKLVAALILDGHEVAVQAGLNSEGFLVDGRFVHWRDLGPSGNVSPRPGA